MSATLLVTVQGEYGLRDWANATEHAEYLVGMVRGYLRGMGLTRRTPEQRAAGYWPGGGGQWFNNEYGDNITVCADYDSLDQARDDADVIAEWLLANGWDDCLEAVYVDDGAGNRTRHDRGHNRG